MKKSRAFIGILLSIAMLMSCIVLPAAAEGLADLESLESITVAPEDYTGNLIYSSETLGNNGDAGIGGTLKDITLSTPRSANYLAVRTDDWSRVREIEVYDSEGNQLTIGNGIASVSAGVLANDIYFEGIAVHEDSGELLPVLVNGADRAAELFDGNYENHVTFSVRTWWKDPVVLINFGELTAVSEVKVYTGYYDWDNNVLKAAEGINIYAAKTVEYIFSATHDPDTTQALGYEHLVYNSDIPDLSQNGYFIGSDYTNVKYVNFSTPRTVSFVAVKVLNYFTRMREIEIYDADGNKLTVDNGGLKGITFGGYAFTARTGFAEATDDSKITTAQIAIDGNTTANIDYLETPGEYWNGTINYATFILELSEPTAISKIIAYPGVNNLNDYNEAVRIYVGDSIDTLFDEPLSLAASDTPYRYGDWDDYFHGINFSSTVHRDNILTGLTPQVMEWETKANIAGTLPVANLSDGEYGEIEVPHTDSPQAVVYDLTDSYEIYAAMLSGAGNNELMVSYNVYVGDDYDTLISDENLLVSVDNNVAEGIVVNNNKHQISVVPETKAGRFVAFYITADQQSWSENPYRGARINELAILGTKLPSEEGSELLGNMVYSDGSDFTKKNYSRDKSVEFSEARAGQYIAVNFTDSTDGGTRIREIELYDANGNKLTLEDISEIKYGSLIDGEVTRRDYTGPSVSEDEANSRLFDSDVTSHFDLNSCDTILISLKNNTEISKIMVYTGIYGNYTYRNATDIYMSEKLEGMFDLPEEVIAGDLDGDGKADAEDLSKLAKSLLKNIGEALDVNGDGFTDIRDLVALKKIVAKAA